eukprot:1115771-Rhodomonas_salina.4
MKCWALGSSYSELSLVVTGGRYHSSYCPTHLLCDARHPPTCVLCNASYHPTHSLRPVRYQSNTPCSAPRACYGMPGSEIGCAGTRFGIGPFTPNVWIVALRAPGNNFMCGTDTSPAALRNMRN